METTREKITFDGAAGDTLAARLDRSAGTVRAYALFAHCFTCSKDVFAASRIAGALAARGIAVLRFDFTGLGASGGDFANTDFSSNVADLVAAADAMRARFEAPKILIGHSLGGAAVLAAAARMPEAVAVATIAAPSDPGHLRHLFAAEAGRIESEGEAEVVIAGRPFRIRKEFLDDIAAQPMKEAIAGLRRALLIFHSPVDQVVGIDSATEIYRGAKHPKSFVSLDDADHLLSRREDAVYVADVLAAWAGRYIGAAPPEAMTGAADDEDEVVVSENGRGPYGQDISVGRHLLHADEPAAFGGRDTGPSPYQLLSAALGACTTMTLRMYADRKGWPLERVSVAVRHDKIHAADCAECETRAGRVDSFERRIALTGALDAEQQARLMEIADRCPVHRTLHSEVRIVTAAEDD